MTWAKLWFRVRKEENLEGGAWYASELQLHPPPAPPALPTPPPRDAGADGEPGAPQSATLSPPLGRRPLKL